MRPLLFSVRFHSLVLLCCMGIAALDNPLGKANKPVEIGWRS